MKEMIFHLLLLLRLLGTLLMLSMYDVVTHYLHRLGHLPIEKVNIIILVCFYLSTLYIYIY